MNVLVLLALHCLLVSNGLLSVRAQSCTQDMTACPDVCHFNGECNEDTGECNCRDGWEGHDCNIRTCGRDACYNGDCCSEGCCCHAGWKGEKCDQLVGLFPYRKPVCDLYGNCTCFSSGVPGPCPEGILPDLIPLMRKDKPMEYSAISLDWINISECDCEIDCVDGPGLRKLLRFPTWSANFGSADLFMGHPSDHLERYIWHQCHKHAHFLHWADFEVRNKVTGKVKKGVKSGSTIIDSAPRSPTAARDRRYNDYIQGIQVGWADWYAPYLPCQYIDITDLPPGDWELSIKLNPYNAISESNYDNNEAVVSLECQPSCVHGACDFGQRCICESGWVGKDCSEPVDDGVCVPDCDERACGSDGCSHTCGLCSPRKGCQDHLCVCTPQCIGMECGSDGCGDRCGVCSHPQDICVNGICKCVGSCEGKECGYDGCIDSCGSCPEGQTCSNENKCVGCEPECEGRSCGDNGCGGSCGECPTNHECYEGQCECQPHCENTASVCGDDGCGGTCGSCEPPQQCTGGQCTCTHTCGDRNCGDDGCGTACGFCNQTSVCMDGICTEVAETSSTGATTASASTPQKTRSTEPASPAESDSRTFKEQVVSISGSHYKMKYALIPLVSGGVFIVVIAVFVFRRIVSRRLTIP